MFVLFSITLLISNYLSYKLGKNSNKNAAEFKIDRNELVQNLFALEKFKEELISQNQPTHISNAIIEYLSTQIKCESVKVYSLDESTSSFKSHSSNEIGYPIYDPFLLWLSEIEGVHLKKFFVEEKNDKYKKIKNEAVVFFESNKAEAVLTMRIKSSLIGFVLLGPKLDGSDYGMKDMERLLEIISVSILAFSNSLMYSQLLKLTENLELKIEERTRELEDTQSQLIHSEKLASLGTMIAGIAHEINTPTGVINGASENLESSMIYTFSHLIELKPIFESLNLSSTFDELMIDLVNSEKREKIDSREKFKIKKEVKQRLLSKNLNESESTEIASFLVEQNMLKKEDQILRIWHEAGKPVYEIFKNASGVSRNIRNIQYAIKNIVRIVKALKYYSHSGQITYNSADIHESIENSLILLQNQWKNGIQIERDFGSIPPIICNIDELIQVWTNLINNAIHALRNIPEAKIKIITSVIDKNSIQLKFEDNGSGIPKEILGKIWDPFFTTKDQGEGTGLGLGIVKGIIERHRGRIEVTSEPGKTVFRIELPKNGPGDLPKIPKDIVRRG